MTLATNCQSAVSWHRRLHAISQNINITPSVHRSAHCTPHRPPHTLADSFIAISGRLCRGRTLKATPAMNRTRTTAPANLPRASRRTNFKVTAHPHTHTHIHTTEVAGIGIRVPCWRECWNELLETASSGVHYPLPKKGARSVSVKKRGHTQTHRHRHTCTLFFSLSLFLSLSISLFVIRTVLDRPINDRGKNNKRTVFGAVQYLL